MQILVGAIYRHVDSRYLIVFFFLVSIYADFCSQSVCQSLACWSVCFLSSVALRHWQSCVHLLVYSLVRFLLCWWSYWLRSWVFIGCMPHSDWSQCSWAVHSSTLLQLLASAFLLILYLGLIFCWLVYFLCLLEVDHFKHLGSTQTKDYKGSKDQTGTGTPSHDISFLQRLNSTNQSLVLSILLYGYESSPLTADLERWIQAFENKCYRRMLGISYRDREQKQTNMYANRPISSPDVRSFYCQASQVTMVRACLSSWCTAEDHSTKNSGW